MNAMLLTAGLPILAVETSIPTMHWWVTGVAAVLCVIGLLVFSYGTRAGIIARATTKESIRQPVFLLVLAIGTIVLLLNAWVPFFSFGDDLKMFKDCGLATILIGGLLLAVWTASTSVAEEIEGKTAMTLLSKPINRRQFIVGKFFGIIQAILLYIIPISVIFMALIAYKVGYDSVEASRGVPEMAERVEAMVKTIPGLVLLFLEISVLAAVSVAISTRLPMVVNIVTCFTIFVIGHLTPVLVQSDTGLGKNEFVQFVAQLIATVLPALDVFNMETAVATGAWVPPDYLGFSLLYSASYCGAAVLLAFILFEDRDLA